MRLNRRRLRAFMRRWPARLPGHFKAFTSELSILIPTRLPNQRQAIFTSWLVIISLLTFTTVWAATHPATKTPAPSPTPSVVTVSTDKPAEDRPKRDTYQWSGAPTMPKYLKLPSIKAEGFVQQVGVDQHKAIAVPTNIHVAGWFVQSQLPGAQGLSIIDGHLDGRTGGGIFEHLAKLKSGDQFTVTYGNDTTKTFIVRKVQSMPTADTAAVLFSQDPKISNQLNLITCGGVFDETRKQYEERVVVVAELVRS